MSKLEIASVILFVSFCLTFIGIFEAEGIKERNIFIGISAVLLIGYITLIIIRIKRYLKTKSK